MAQVITPDPSLSITHGPPLPDQLPTAWSLFITAYQRNPSSLCLICTHQPATLYSIPSTPLENPSYEQGPYLRWTYANLKLGIDRLSSGLRKVGVKKDTPVFTFLDNRAEWVLMMWACIQLGATLVPLNKRNLKNAVEVTHMWKTAIQGSGSDQTPFVVVDSEAVAREVDQFEEMKGARRFLVRARLDGWETFAELMEDDAKLNGEQDYFSSEQDKDAAFKVVLFTSGSTSLPKGCKWTDRQAVTFALARRQMRGSQPNSRSCLFVPNNHAMGLILLFCSQVETQAIVYPGPAFDASTVADVLKNEKVGYTVMVPVMVHAVIGALKQRGEKLHHLKGVSLGGAPVHTEALTVCQNELGAQAIENAYGMTEGVLNSTGYFDDVSVMAKGDDIAVGAKWAGASMKVCKPGESAPVPRNQPGELHYGSLSLVDGYIGKESTDFYYDEDGKRWFVTGDRVVMDEKDRIFIMGRYKEMIIRGGENISPLAIESIASRDPRILPLQLQVVGAKDSIAGEVPVAVVKAELNPEIEKQLQDTVIKNMGPAYALDEVIPIQALGMEDYPRTMTGKVQKVKLASIVQQYRDQRDAAPVNGLTNGARHDFEDLVKRVWARTLGIDTSKLSLNSPIREFADSITIMRARDQITKQTGRALSLTEMADVDTIATHIRFLENRAPKVKGQPKVANARQGPPTLDDMVHLTEDPELFDGTRQLIKKTILPYGLEWEDVEDVMPANDFIQTLSQNGMLNDWRFKMTLKTTASDPDELRAALEIMLKNNPLLASFLVWSKVLLESDIALHVTIRHTPKYLDHIITDGGNVGSLQGAQLASWNYPQPHHAKFPGPLLRILMLYVEETKAMAAIFHFSHAIVDASYAQILFDDLARALSGLKPHPHTPFKVWADSYYSLKHTPEARAATKWHVKRLQNLKDHGPAMWPKLKGDLDVESVEINPLEWSYEAPGVQALRKKYKTLTAPVTLKAAQALLNINRTEHTHSVFASIEAARSRFPFIPKSMEHMVQYEATDVAGAVFTAVIDFIEVKPEETVLEFLHRLQEEQTLLTKYAHAPWSEITKGLGPGAEVVLAGITRTQVFNWVSMMGVMGTKHHDNLEVLNFVSRPERGLGFAAGLGGETGNTMFMLAKGDRLSDEEIAIAAKELQQIHLWLTEPRNWERRVGEFRECLA